MDSTDRRDEEPQAPSSPDALQRAVAFNRLGLLAVAGLILVMLASWLTLGVLHYSRDELPDLRPDLAALDLRLTRLEARLQSQEAALQALQRSLAERPDHSLVDSDPALREQLLRGLAGQEKRFQQTLVGLKDGMRDLAGMMTGSRSWLEHYQEALNRPLAESRERLRELEALLQPPAEANTAPVSPPTREPEAP